MKLTMNIYDKKGNLIRIAEGNTTDITLGTVETLMGVLDIDEDTSSMEVMRKVGAAYKELRGILSDVFGDITEDEWKNVHLKELLPIILQIVKFTFAEMNLLPAQGNSKN